MAECTTHHHACDCREAQFAALECEAEEQSRLIEKQANDIAQLMAERDAAFSMSKCECGSDECCANLVQWKGRAEKAEAERDALRKRIEDAPVANMDTRDLLGICAPTEDDFPALYALQGKRVRLVLEGE